MRFLFTLGIVRAYTPIKDRKEDCAMTEKTLLALEKNEVGTVISVQVDGAMRRRFYDIGCIKGAKIRLIGVSPFGDPRAYAICGAMIAIRAEDAKRIRIRVDDI